MECAVVIRSFERGDYTDCVGGSVLPEMSSERKQGDWNDPEREDVRREMHVRVNMIENKEPSHTGHSLKTGKSNTMDPSPEPTERVQDCKHFETYLGCWTILVPCIFVGLGSHFLAGCLLGA